MTLSEAILQGQHPLPFVSLSFSLAFHVIFFPVRKLANLNKTQKGGSSLNDWFPQYTSTHSNMAPTDSTCLHFFYTLPQKSLSSYPLFVVPFLFFIYLFFCPSSRALKPKFHVLVLILDLGEAVQKRRRRRHLSYCKIYCKKIFSCLPLPFSSAVSVLISFPLILFHFFSYCLLFSSFLFFDFLPLHSSPLLPSAPFFPQHII